MISIRQRKHPDTGDYFIAKNLNEMNGNMSYKKKL